MSIYHREMFKGLGSVINASTIVLGTSIGIVFGAKLKESARELIMSSLGLITAIAAADMVKEVWNQLYKAALPKGWAIISILISLIIGGLLGDWFQIESKLETLGNRLKIALASVKPAFAAV